MHNASGRRDLRHWRDYYTCLTASRRSGLNRGPFDYESSALPLSYAGDCESNCEGYEVLGMPWRGLEPRRLAAPPPQDGVSTNFTTRATLFDASRTHLQRHGRLDHVMHSNDARTTLVYHAPTH